MRFKKTPHYQKEPAFVSNEQAVILHLDGIGRTYGDTDSTPALSDVHLTVRAGEFVAIVGSSGAGKSTLLNILGLLDRPSTGKYSVAGEDVSTLNDAALDRLRARMFGFVFQDSHMILKKTAAENASLGLAVNAVAPQDRGDLVAAALHMVGLLPKAQDLARTLSGGERQRAAIARAIATAPRVLLADEPTGSLDEANTQRVLHALHELNTHGTTVVLITHDAEVAKSARRIVEIKDGYIASDTVTATPAAPTTSAPPPAGQLHDPQPHDPRQKHRTPGDIPRQTQPWWSRLNERIISAISNHSIHVARAFVLLLAFAVGSAGLVAAIGLSQSAAAQVVNRLDSAASDEFLIVPKPNPDDIRAELTLPADASPTVVATEALHRLEQFASITNSGFMADATFGNGITKFNPQQLQKQPVFKSEFMLADKQFLSMRGVRINHSTQSLRFFDSEEQEAVVAIGASLAEKLGYTSHVPGSELWIGSRPVAIVGIITSAGDEPKLDAKLLVNPALAETVEMLDATLLVKTTPGAPASIAPLVDEAITPGNPKLYKAEPVADLRSLTSQVAADLVALVRVVSWAVLGLSTLSAATATFLAVHARAAEIALRRAVGESKQSIWAQFVLEGITIGLLGGVCGSALGVIVFVTVAAGQGWTATMSPWVLGVGVAAGVITSILASLYPAAVAARQDPALAVRGQ